MLDYDQIITVDLRIRDIKDKDPALPETLVITLFTLSLQPSSYLPSPPEVVLDSNKETHFELVSSFQGIFHPNNKDKITQSSKDLLDSKSMRINKRSYNIRLHELINILAEGKKLEWIR